MNTAQAFDYVIVGGGSAGAVVAARLSEDPAVSVALIEAGPSDMNEDVVLRLDRWMELLESGFDWIIKSNRKLTATPLCATRERRCLVVVRLTIPALRSGRLRKISMSGRNFTGLRAGLQTRRFHSLRSLRRTLIRGRTTVRPVQSI